MEFVNDPVKSKRIFILMLILTIFFFLTSAVLGVMDYWKYQSARTEKQELERRLENAAADLQKQISKLEQDKKDLAKEKLDLEKENSALKGQVASFNAKLNKVKTYNDCLNYVYTLIGIHNGFSDWTDAEYQTGRVKAQATGDSNLVSTIDWAWNSSTTDPIVRLVAVLKALSDGISGVL